MAKNTKKQNNREEDVFNLGLNEESLGYIKVLAERGIGVNITIDRFRYFDLGLNSIDVSGNTKQIVESDAENFRNKLVWIVCGFDMYKKGKDTTLKTFMKNLSYNGPDNDMYEENASGYLRGMDYDVNKAVLKFYMNVIANVKNE